MVNLQKVENSCGEMMELLPVGTRVAHREYPQLTGKIVSWEYHKSGKVSPLPYKVYWDNNELAFKLIGPIFWLYPLAGDIVPID